jgi:inositol oxygenase
VANRLAVARRTITVVQGSRGITYKAKRTVLRAFSSAGYELKRIDRRPQPDGQFARDADVIWDRRAEQTLDDALALRDKYQAAVFDEMSMWDALNMLAHVIDPIDRFLGNVSQEVHVLQVVEGMVAEGADDEMLLAGLIHDVGKLLYFVDEEPENISGTSSPVADFDTGVGLDQCVLQFGADDYAYSKIVGIVPDHVSWLVRYHSIVPDSCERLMDERDREYYERYWPLLHRLDGETKSMYRLPRTRLSDYRSLVDDAFPEPIPF